MVNGRSSMCDRLKSVRQWSPRWCHDEINISHRHCSGPALSGSVSYGPLFWSCDNIEKKNCLGFLGFQGCLWVIYSVNRLFFRGKELSHPWYVHLSQNASVFAIFFLLNTCIFDTRMFNKSRHVRYSNELCVAVGMLYFMSQ